MRVWSVLSCILLLIGLGGAQQSLAFDFFFEPDTSFGYVGDTLLISGWIGVSDSMRGFTVYMAYDTTCLDLAQPVAPGSLIAEREGLEFHYFDHSYQPDLLEVGGTVWSSDFWAGPGEIFQLHFELRQRADVSITAPWPSLFVDSHGGFPEVTFHGAIVFIHESSVGRYLEAVQKPFEVGTIYPNPSNSTFAIRFFVPRSVCAEVIVYNLLGQQISRIAGQMFSAGWHDLRWDAKDSPSGIYMAVFSSPPYQMTKKLILLK